MTEERENPAAQGVSCAVCGTVAPDGPPLTWTLQVGDRRTEHLCERCSRENIRGIEGRLDATWW